VWRSTPATALPQPQLRVTAAVDRVGVDARTRDRAHVYAGLELAVCGVFLVHALNYLYFFVDDEAIPIVFAKHLLQGKGLVYNSLEGRVEGYSDFLHVLMTAVYLLVARLLRLGPLAVFFMAKAVSFASGIATVAVVGRALRRDASIELPARLAGMAFLVLAPPLAIWSCSSLEMASLTLLTTLIAINVFEGSPARDGMTALAACLLVLLRIDGFVYVFGLLAPAWLFASSARRREMVGRIVVPVVIVLAIYHAWRVWYFGDWVPAPFVAKVLYKLHPPPNALVHGPQTPYLLAFLHMYGVVPTIVALGLVIWAVRGERRIWSLLASASILIAYPTLVGDWMWGFRFFLPVVPVIAVLIAVAVSSVDRRRLAWGTAMVACLWFSGVAVRAAAEYDRLDYRQGWWRAQSFDPQRYFGPYLRVYDSVKGLVKPGALIAYDQAGLVPYLLDVDNIDDLGICSRFVARMPTRDVIFTEAGRYSPLTNATALRAANAYLLYRAPEIVIAPLGNLRAANQGEIPERILRSQYIKMFAVPHAPAVVYGRVPGSNAEFQSSSHIFLENVAHPSRIQRASSDEVIPPGEYLSQLLFLAGGALDRAFSGHIRYDVVFATTNEPVYELHVDGIWARTDVTMVLTLRTADGAIARRETQRIAANHPERVRLFWPEGLGAARLTLELNADGAPQTRVILRDLRVQGQPGALARYVAQLSFPPNATRR
jgi:hypothetical protein